MSWKQQFRSLLRLLYYAGILPATYCHDRQKLVSSRAVMRRSNWMTALLSLMVTGFLIQTIYVAHIRNFNIYGPGKMGNTLIVFQVLACAVVQLALSGSLFARRCHHVRMLNVIWKHATFAPLGASGSAEGQRLSRSMRNLSLMTVLLLAIFEWNVLISCLGDGVPMSAAVCCFVILSVHYASASLVMTSYSCTILIVSQLIGSYNSTLMALCSTKSGKRTAADIRHLLRLRAELLSLCSTQISRIYGQFVLLESCYVLCTVPAFPFLISIIFEWGVPDWAEVSDLLYKTFLWVSSFFIYMYPLVINTISAETKKTVHILSLVPRSDYGVQKTVEKFLLKNLLQKPIITAYGFYALDNGALFQLLTVILPFMVILLQFKQTEFLRRVWNK